MEVEIAEQTPASAAPTALALGSGATAEGQHSIALGSKSRALAPMSVAIGVGAYAKDPGQVVIGQLGSQVLIGGFNFKDHAQRLNNAEVFARAAYERIVALERTVDILLTERSAMLRDLSGVEETAKGKEEAD